MAKFISMAFTNAAEGRDDEYNDWYTNQHVLDVLCVPGIMAAQRFRLSEQSRAAFGYRYLAIYETEADSPADIHMAVAERAGTARMPRSDAMSPDRLFLDLVPIMQRITREEAAEKRKEDEA